MIHGADCNAWQGLDGWTMGIFYTDAGVSNKAYGLCIAETNSCVGYYINTGGSGPEMGSFYYAGALMSATKPAVGSVFA